MEEVKRAFDRLVVATIVLFLFCVALAVAGCEAHSAVCTFRSDLKSQMQQSREFLRAHPHGIPGISGVVIRTRIAAQQKTVDSLHVHCGF